MKCSCKFFFRNTRQFLTHLYVHKNDINFFFKCPWCNYCFGKRKYRTLYTHVDRKHNTLIGNICDATSSQSERQVPQVRTITELFCNIPITSKDGSTIESPCTFVASNAMDFVKHYAKHCQINVPVQCPCII